MTIAAVYKNIPVEVLGANHDGAIVWVEQTRTSYIVPLDDVRFMPSEEAVPCDELDNWLAAMKDVDAMCELDGPVPGLLAAVAFERECAGLYFKKVYGEES